MDVKIGDRVRANDPGLIMLQQFAPLGAKPNNEGFVVEIDEEEGTAMIEFPIGDDDMSEHSQCAPYEIELLTVIPA